MVNYNNSKIYKIEPIESNELNDIYIGATKNKYLSARFAIHKHDYKLWKDNLRTNIKSFDLFSAYQSLKCFIIIKLITAYRGVTFTKAGKILFSLNVLLQSMPFFEIICLCIQFFTVLSFSAKACFG